MSQSLDGFIDTEIHFTKDYPPVYTFMNPEFSTLSGFPDPEGYVRVTARKIVVLTAKHGSDEIVLNTALFMLDGEGVMHGPVLLHYSEEIKPPLFYERSSSDPQQARIHNSELVGIILERFKDAKPIIASQISDGVLKK